MASLTYFEVFARIVAVAVLADRGGAAPVVLPTVPTAQISPTPGHCRHSPPNFFKNYQRGNRYVTSHRGPYGRFEGKYLPDNSLEAIERGYQRFKIAEFDAVPDAKGELVGIHDLDRFRQSAHAGLLGDKVFADFSNEDKEYVLRKIEDDAYQQTFERLGMFWRTTREQIARTLACEPGLNLIVDTRENHAIYGVKLMNEMKEVRDQVLIQVYNFGFPKGAAQFVDACMKIGADPKEVGLIITPNPGYFAAMAGIAEDVPDHEAILKSQLS